MTVGKVGFIVLTLAATSLLLWFSTFSHSTEDNPSIHQINVSEDVYAPFDSIRTDVEDYIWPTNASKKMSSGFAEFRRTHFHAGIDISTNNRQGYPVYASRDGHISRIYISPFGYGKMIHVKHADGYTTTYAHLQRFNDVIEAHAKKLQYKEGVYSLDEKIEENLFPVRKGETIAFSGNTGIGLPHLHFELRDPENNPINPFFITSFTKQIDDTLHPDLQRIGFIPIDYSSSVNRDFRPWSTSLLSMGNFRHETPSSVHLDGRIGIIIKGTDRVNSSWHRIGIYQLEMYLNDSLLYRSKLGHFLHSEARQIALYYDWSSVSTGKGRYQKLFIDKGNRLSIYDRLPEGSGIIDTRQFPDGKYNLRIVATDIKGNQASITAPLLFSRAHNIQVTRAGKSLSVRSEKKSDIRSIIISSKPNKNTQWKEQSFDVRSLGTENDEFLIPFTLSNDLSYKLKAVDDLGISSNATFVTPKEVWNRSTNLKIEHEFLRDYFYVRISSNISFDRKPSLSVVDGKTSYPIEVSFVNDKTFAGAFPLTKLQSESFRLEIADTEGNPNKVRSKEFTFYPIYPEKGGSITIDDEKFSLFFPAESVYEPLFCRVEKHGETYSVFPKHVLLRSEVDIRLRVPSSSMNRYLGLFYEDDGEIKFLSKLDSSDQSYLYGKVSRLLGDFWAAYDSTAPAISPITIRYSQENIHLSFRVNDDLSGIHPDKINLTIDGAPAIPEYDPYGKRVAFKGKLKQTGKPKTVRLRVEDRIGNLSEFSRSIP